MADDQQDSPDEGDNDDDDDSTNVQSSLDLTRAVLQIMVAVARLLRML